LRILQQNLNHSSMAQNALLHRDPHRDFDILLLQEPSINTLNGYTIANPNFAVAYPPDYDFDTKKPARAITLINKDINTNAYEILPFPGRDVSAIQLKGEFGRITIFNIYNSCDNSDTIH
ncbi:hypothetical protein PENSPDRAFT_551512, partial [Peniophora sp. CONT]